MSITTYASASVRTSSAVSCSRPAAPRPRRTAPRPTRQRPSVRPGADREARGTASAARRRLRTPGHERRATTSGTSTPSASSAPDGDRKMRLSPVTSSSRIPGRRRRRLSRPSLRATGSAHHRLPSAEAHALSGGPARGSPSPRRLSGSSSIAVWNAAVASAMNAAWSRASVSELANAITPTRFVARDLRRRSASSVATCWRRARASPRRSASSGSEVIPSSSWPESKRPQRLPECHVVSGSPRRRFAAANGSTVSGCQSPSLSGAAR